MRLDLLGKWGALAWLARDGVRATACYTAGSFAAFDAYEPGRLALFVYFDPSLRGGARTGVVFLACGGGFDSGG